MIAIIIGILVLVIAIAAFYLSGGFDAGPGPVVAPTVDDVPPEDIGMDINIQFDEEDEEDLQEDFSMVEITVPDTSGKFKPTSISGLVGWYTGASFDNDTGEWIDISGEDNHAVDVLGGPESVEGDKGSNNQKYVIGTEDDGLKFPVEVLTTGRKFTMFHVSRYNTEQIEDYNAPGMGRIFDGTDNGFVSGAHGGKSGWSHRNGAGALTNGGAPGRAFYNKFAVNTDQKTLYRFNGVQRSGLPNLSALTPGQMTINYGEARAGNYGQHGERSVWAVAEVLFYNRELSGKDIEKIEDYLFAKYGVKKLAYSHQVVRNPFKKEVEGIQNMGASCGNQGAMSSTWLRRHYSRYTEKDENGNDKEVLLPNGNYFFENGCVQGISEPVDGNTKSTEPVEGVDKDTLNQDGDAWFESAQKVYNMNCRTSPITEYKFKQVGDKMKSEYTCSVRKVVEDSCEEKLSDGGSRTGDGNFFENMHMEKINCYPKVLTAMELVKDPEGEGYRIKGKCCNLQDV